MNYSLAGWKCLDVGNGILNGARFLITGLFVGPGWHKQFNVGSDSSAALLS